MKTTLIKDAPEEKEFKPEQSESSAAAAESAQERNRRLQRQGVTIPDITAVWIDPAVEVAAGCILYPNTHILGQTQIGADCRIGPDCRIVNAEIGRGSRINQSQIESSVLAAGCTVESNCQLKDAQIGENSRIMQSYVASSRVAADCVIGPFSHIRANAVIDRGSRVMQSQLEDSRVAADCEIGPFSHIRANAEIGRGSRVAQSRIEDSQVAEECNIGPFSYIRPGSVIGSRVRIGDFVEIKNSVIGEDTMISHLTYVGDADVGRKVNFGCGTVLVNYDGIEKHRSVIGDHAFIGCNTNLVSPVQIGEGAFTAAGSTITEDLPPGSLGIARARQQIKENWVTNRKGNYKGGGNK